MAAIETTAGLRIVLALLATLAAAVAAPVSAADSRFQLGIDGGSGNNVNVFGVQAAWSPQVDSPFLERHDIEPRVIGQLAYWRAHDHPEDNRSLVDGSLLGALHWTIAPGADYKPFVEAAFGVELLSHVKINGRDLTTAFQFGSQLAAGLAFGADRRYEIAGFIHHTSNADIKLPNWGLTYVGAMLRVALR